MGASGVKGCGTCSMEVCSAVESHPSASMMSGLRHPLRARIDQQYLFDPSAVLPSSLGVLCRASQEPGGGIVVKSIPKLGRIFTATASSVDLVKQELEQLQRCDHPNVCKIYEVYEDAERLYAVMEELNSDNLLLLPTRVPELTEAVVVGVVRKIVSAVAYLHDRGVQLLDLRPENVVFTDPSNGWPPAPQWNVKLIDFGLAARHTDRGAFRLAASPYVAPEQITGETADKRADLWALGALTFMLLSGSTPFPSTNPATRAASIRAGIWSFDPAPAWRSISDDAKAFVTELMQRDPAARLTPAQALQHPWLCNEAKADMSTIADDTRKSLLREGTISMLQPILVMAIARNLSHGGIMQLRKSVEVEDTARSGEVSFTNLRRALMRLNVSLAGHHARLLGALDSGPEWMVQYGDLFDQAIIFREAVQAEVALSLFRRLDQDRASSTSLAAAIKKEAQLPHVVGAETTRVVLSDLQTPGDLGFEQLATVLQNAAARSQAVAPPPPSLVIPTVRTTKAR